MSPSYNFATAPHPVLPEGAGAVFFDSTFSEPRLQHPEGVAIGPDGHIWCGSENGEILRIAPDASGIERVASTGGFILGLAFDGDRALFACDLRHAAVFRLDLSTRAVTRFTAPGIHIPDFPVVDRARGRLMVSDSHASGQPGPGIWAYELQTGAGELWDQRSYDFANGMALTPDGGAILVCETFSRRITRVEIAADGSPGATRPYSEDLPGLPDGIAFDDARQLFVGCYEPSRILRIPEGGGAAEVYFEDPTAHLLAHPTNIAFDGVALFTANLGRWHISRIQTDTVGTPLHIRSDRQAGQK